MADFVEEDAGQEDERIQEQRDFRAAHQEQDKALEVAVKPALKEYQKKDGKEQPEPG